MYGADRQQTMAVGMDAAQTRYNYIAQYISGTHKWNVVVKDFTGASPTVTQVENPGLPPGMTTGSVYGQLHYSSRVNQQLRAPNGRIFLPQSLGYTNYYDPTDEQIYSIGPIVQSPPTTNGAISIYYRASFDVDGGLWMTTNEVQSKPSCVVYTDTTTLAQNIVGYVGSGATVYSTYGFWIAPDVGTSVKKVYVIYGQSPWQLWSLDVNTGVATKLSEVSSTGSMAFQDITGKGWVAHVQTVASDLSTRVSSWCLDGALYSYTAGVAPPGGLARNVTPTTNPLPAGAPNMHPTNQAGIVAYRFGLSGAYSYVNYEINDAGTIAIESLVAGNDSIVGNGASYAGFFRHDPSDDSYLWFGSYTSFSQGPRLNLAGLIYGAAYPNGVFIKWDPSAAWNPGTTTGTNPENLGAFGAQGIQDAGVKHVDQLVWASAAGTSGRFYCSGPRERNGNGCGIGYYDVATANIEGTYARPELDPGDPRMAMAAALPDGLVVLPGISRVVMSTHLLAAFTPGTAKLFVFDYDLGHIATLSPLAGVTALGPIFATTVANVITGIVQGSGNQLGLWQYNVQTQTLVSYVELPIVGTLQTLTIGTMAACQRVNGAVYLISGSNLVSVDVTNLTATVLESVASIQPITAMAFGAETSKLYLAGGDNGGEVFSINTADALAFGSGTGVGAFSAITFVSAVRSLLFGSGAGIGLFEDLTFTSIPAILPAASDNVIRLRNDESTTAVVGQPVCSIENGVCRLAFAAAEVGRAIVAGIVTGASIASGSDGEITTTGLVRAKAAEWDAICGTTNGLVAGTTYYLHPTITGRLTATAPTTPGQRVVPVITAIASTEAVIAIQPPVLL